MYGMLKEGLEEAIKYHKEKVKLRTKRVFIPDSPKSAKDIKKLRKKFSIAK